MLQGLAGAATPEVQSDRGSAGRPILRNARYRVINAGRSAAGLSLARFNPLD
jgi:hypothetical protein